MQPNMFGRCTLVTLMMFVGGCSSWTSASRSHAKPLLRCLTSQARPLESSVGLLRLRGGIGEAAGALSDRASGIARDVAGHEWHEFGTGPGHTDRSGSKFEARPTGLYADDTFMDGGCACMLPPLFCATPCPCLNFPSATRQRIARE